MRELSEIKACAVIALAVFPALPGSAQSLPTEEKDKSSQQFSEHRAKQPLVGDFDTTLHKRATPGLEPPVGLPRELKQTQHPNKPETVTPSLRRRNIFEDAKQHPHRYRDDIKSPFRSRLIAPSQLKQSRQPSEPAEIIPTQRRNIFEEVKQNRYKYRDDDSPRLKP